MSGPDVMRLLRNASAALDNVRYFIEHRDEDAAVVQRSAEGQMWMALDALEQLKPLIGDDNGAAMIAAELTICHAPTDEADPRKLCRLEQGHDDEHMDSFMLHERDRQQRWLAGTIYDFEREQAKAFLASPARVAAAGANHR